MSELDIDIAEFQRLVEYLSDDFAPMFGLAAAETAAEAIERFSFGTVTPTAVGSTQITVRDGAGIEFDLRGSGFGPITSVSSLQTAFDDFIAAVELLDGTATANVTSLTIRDTNGGGVLARLDVTPTRWTITSGDNEVRINGQLPNTLADIEDMITALVPDIETGDLVPAGTFNPATSVLRNYDIDSVELRESGVLQSSLTFGTTALTLTVGDYTATLSGNWPDNFAEVAQIGLLLNEDLATTGYDVTRLRVTDGQGREVVDFTPTSMDLADLGDSLDAVAVEMGLFGFQTVNGRIDSGTDTDFLLVQIENPNGFFSFGPNTFQFDVFGTQGTPLADPLLRVYDSDGTPLAVSDNSNGTLNPRAFVQADVGDVLILEVASGGASGTGDYRVQIQQTFTPPPATLPPGRMDQDLSGDGLEDILWFNSANNQVGFYEMGQNGAFAWQSLGFAGTNYSAVNTGDFNADSFDDILWLNGTTQQVGYYKMGQNGAFSWQSLGIAGGGYQIAGTGDFNADSTSDILWYNTQTQQVGFYRMADTTFTWQGLGLAGANYVIAGTDDFNGDGTDDILWFNTASRQLGYYQMDNDSFVWRGLGFAGANYEVAGTGDFNGDGTDDILWFNTATNQVGFYAMNTNGGFVWQGLGIAGANYEVADIGNYDGDGTDDILWFNTASRQLGYYDMNGAAFSWQGLGFAGPNYDIAADEAM